MGFCLAQDSIHLHHPLKASQQGVLGFTFTYGDFCCHNTPTHSSDIHRPGIPQPMYVLKVKLALFVQSDLIVALTTIHRSTFAGLERYFGVFATLSAYGGEHLASGSVAVTIISITLCLPCLAACRTALRLVSIASRLEELLLLSTERESSPTIRALERLVLKAHWMTSSL